MKNLVLLLLTLILGATALLGTARWLFGRDGEEVVWTTRSPQAREEFEAALADFRRYYWDDAKEHLERALELDPDFTIAKLYLVNVRSGWPNKQLIEELQAADTTPLSGREQLLLKYRGLRHQDQSEQAASLLADYLQQTPDDPYALSLRCEELWVVEESTGAAAVCYREMAELHPNWVLAHNRLGYLEMAQARFASAENEFCTYRYIAPDQANPHDSLGELLTLVGRYEEAEKALLAALSIKSNFCSAQFHLGSLYLLWGRSGEIEQRLASSGADDTCSEGPEMAALACQARLYPHYLAGELEQAWQALEECDAASGLFIWRFRLALATGRPEAADEVEEALLVRRRLHPSSTLDGIVLHLEGLRRMHAGEPAQAAELFALADQVKTYRTSESGRSKLFNLLHWSTALEAAGDSAAAAEVQQRLAAVNPRYLESVRITDLPSFAAALEN